MYASSIVNAQISSRHIDILNCGPTLTGMAFIWDARVCDGYKYWLGRRRGWIEMSLENLQVSSKWLKEIQPGTIA